MSTSSVFHVTGKLFDPQRVELKRQAFHVYSPDNRYITYGKTNDDGTFDIAIHGEQNSTIDLLFRQCVEHFVVDEHPMLQKSDRLKCDLSFLRKREEVAAKEGKVSLTERTVSIGDIVFEHNVQKEQVPFSYYKDVGIAGAKAKALSLWEQLKDTLYYRGSRTIPDLVAAFGCPHTDLTADNTWDLITNGICPHYLKEEGNSFLAEINWDAYEFDKLDSLPNVKVWFKKNDTERPSLEKIELSFRKEVVASTTDAKYSVKTYHPSSPDLQEGLRACNSAFHIYGQTVYHLGIGHVYGTQVALAAHDFLQDHPLGTLLLPHCKFIRKISQELGKAAIFGDTGILNDSSLSPVGIAHLISDTLAAQDPFSFKPRKPLGESHHFAKAQQLHFDLLTKAVEEYFDENWAAIKDNWEPVHLFFNRLFKRSPLFKPWNGEDPKTVSWVDVNEMGALSSGLPARIKLRPEDNEVRSFRPIATNSEKPNRNDRKHIEKFAVHFIHLVTFWHSWIHRSQYTKTLIAPAVTDVDFSPITLSQQGTGPSGGITRNEAVNQLELGTTFQNFPTRNYTLSGNSEVYAGIRNKLIESQESYKALSINPLEEIQFSTVI